METPRFCVGVCEIEQKAMNFICHEKLEEKAKVHIILKRYDCRMKSFCRIVTIGSVLNWSIWKEYKYTPK